MIDEVFLQHSHRNIMGWTSPISLIIFLARSSIHSHVRVALPPLLNRLLLPLFYLKTCDLVASNIRKPSMSLAFLIDWDIISIDFVATLLSQIETLEVLPLTLFKPFPLYSWWFEPPVFRRGINDILRYERYRVRHEAGFLYQHCLGQVWWHMTAFALSRKCFTFQYMLVLSDVKVALKGWKSLKQFDVAVIWALK